MDTWAVRAIRSLAYEKAGIALGEDKDNMVMARIAKRMAVLGLSEARDYLRVLRNDPSGEELMPFLDAITTNYTSFFREPTHFDVLRDSIRARVEAGANRIRVWCAAASTGEEPYSIAMVLAAFVPASVDLKILATDISMRALTVAKAGIYTKERIRSVPSELAEQFLQPIPPAARGAPPTYRVTPELQSLIVFERLNLATPPFPMRGPLDAVMCRNVMIYFDTPIRQRLVSEVERLLAPRGRFIVGHSETLTGVTTSFKMLRPSVYEAR